MSEELKNKESNSTGSGAMMGLVFGAGVGLLFGIIFIGSGFGVAMGLVFGAGIGLVFNKSFNRNS